MNGIIVTLILLPVLLVTCVKVPSLEGTSKDPIFAIADEDVFIDCTVRDLANYTLVWRYTSQSESTTPVASLTGSPGGDQARIISSSTWLDKSPSSSSVSASLTRGEVLTAGKIRVTSDNRYSILHEAGKCPVDKVGDYCYHLKEYEEKKRQKQSIVFIYMNG